MKVSVCIPSYNHHAFVAKAISSVLEQDYGDIELIVIDDGSKDGSKDIIAALHQNAERPFIFINRENRGLVATLAQALEMSTGEFFCELASDDYLHSSSISQRVNYLIDHPQISAVFTDGYQIDNDGAQGPRFTKEKTKAMYQLADPIPAILNNITPGFATGLFRTQWLKDAGGFDSSTFRFYEDIDTPARLALKGPFGYIDEPLFYRRVHGSNVSGTTTHIRREKVLFYSKILQHPGMQAYRPIARRMHRRAVLALARMLCKAEKIQAIDYGVLTQHADAYWFDPRVCWYVFLAKRRFERLPEFDSERRAA